jgi:hypothetical protein
VQTNSAVNATEPEYRSHNLFPDFCFYQLFPPWKNRYERGEANTLSPEISGTLEIGAAQYYSSENRLRLIVNHFWSP